MVTIQSVQTKKDFKQFIEFAYDLYVGDPCFVPELYIAQEDMMNKDKNPFFDHAIVESFLAYRDGRVVGRIAAIRDDSLIEFTDMAVGAFGFFEAIDDYDVAKTLLDTAAGWLRSKGLNYMEGPYNYSTNQACGLLIEGFDKPPSIMMTYNKPYYQKFFENYGLIKKTDVLAYRIHSKDFPQRLKNSIPLLERIFEKNGIRIRPINMKKFDQDVASTLKVYNKAWSKNLGFAPMTEKEFLHAGKDMKMIIDPNLVLLAEKDGQPVGFSLTLPDINQILIRIKRGRLFPTGIFKLLFQKNKINSVRILALGVLEEYRKLGIDAYFYAKAFEYVSNHKHLTSGEASWILEDNPEMNNAIIKMGGVVEKRYRFYRMAL